MKKPVHFSASEKGWELIGTRGAEFKGEQFMAPKFAFYLIEAVNPVKTKFRKKEVELFSKAPRSVLCSPLTERRRTTVRCFSKAFRVLPRLKYPEKITPEELERLEKEAEKREELTTWRELLEKLYPLEEREEEIIMLPEEEFMPPEEEEEMPPEEEEE